MLRMAGQPDFPVGFLGAGGRLPKARRGRFSLRTSPSSEYAGVSEAAKRRKIGPSV